MVKLSDLPIGSLVQHTPTKYLNKPIVFEVVAKNHAGYPGNSVTLQTKQIITSKAVDAKEPQSNDSNRRNYGNNNTTVANLMQWLNSRSNNWYSAQHANDQAPDSTNVVSINPYATEKGFLQNFAADFVDAILPTTLTAVLPTTDGGGKKTETRKVFLPSRTEVGLGDEVSGSAEGSKWAKYTDNASRIKTRTQESINQSNGTTYDQWWLRTPYVSNSHSVRRVHSDGSLSSISAFSGYYGVAPALNLPSDLTVSDSGGVYELEFNKPPSINTSEPDNKGNQTKPFSVSYNVTDAENDKTDVVEKLNGVVIREIENIAFGQQQTISISEEQWNNLPTGQESNISIEANAENGNGSTKVIRFVKTNNVPTITLETPDDETLNHGDEIDLKGTAIDPDDGDAVTVYFSVNKGSPRALKSYISSGAAESFSKKLRMETDGQAAKLMDGSTVVASGLAGGVYHTLEVWAQDNHSGKSIELSRRFKVVPNRPPKIEITTTPTGNDIVENESLSISGNVSDPDGDNVNIQAQVGLGAFFQDVMVNEDGTFTVEFLASDLSNGGTIITLVAKDPYGASDTKQVRVSKNEKLNDAPSPVLRYNLQEPPTPIDSVKVWVKVNPTDYDVELKISEWVDGVETWNDVEYEETVSPTGAKELYFEHSLTAHTEKVALAFTKFKGINMIIGGMTDSTSTYRLDMVEGAVLDLGEMILGV